MSLPLDTVYASVYIRDMEHTTTHSEGATKMTKAQALTGTTDQPTTHSVELITLYPERVATFCINDAYKYGYGLLNGAGAYLVRAQSNDLDRMELEAKRFAHGLAVDRKWTHAWTDESGESHLIGVDAK